MLIDHDWPGNIRELKNVIEHMIITTKGDVISIESLPTEIRGTNAEVDPGSYSAAAMRKEILPNFSSAKKELVACFEKDYLGKLLEKNSWNVTQSAKEIKMHRSSFQRLMRKHGLQARH